jgi:hypothetical protein
MDRKVIDGILHAISRFSYALGVFFRDFIDGPLVNGFGDLMGEGTKWLGDKIKVVQTGKVQQYMLIALGFAFVALIYFVFNVLL